LRSVPSRLPHKKKRRFRNSQKHSTQGKIAYSLQGIASPAKGKRRKAAEKKTNLGAGKNGASPRRPWKRGGTSKGATSLQTGKAASPKTNLETEKERKIAKSTAIVKKVNAKKPNFRFQPSVKNRERGGRRVIEGGEESLKASPNSLSPFEKDSAPLQKVVRCTQESTRNKGRRVFVDAKRVHVAKKRGQ